MSIRHLVIVLLAFVCTALIAAPTAKELVPASAPHGARVIIVGSELHDPAWEYDFTPITVVFTGSGGDAEALIVGRSVSEIKAVVPTSAITGPVQIRYNGISFGTFNFTLTPNPPVVHVSTLAGGPLSSAFGGPTGIASGQNIRYVVDTIANQVKKIDGQGEVSVLAGSGDTGFTDGTGTEAKFYSPRAQLANGQDGLYLADTGNNAIRRISSAGVVTTVAGTGNAGDVVGAVSDAEFRGPTGIAIKDGNVYVADTENNKIKKISSSGIVSTLAILNDPRGIAASWNGHLFVTADHAVYWINKNDGQSTLVAGSENPGFAEGTGSQASFNSPTGIVIKPFLNLGQAEMSLFVADTGNHMIRKIDVPAEGAQGTTSTIAGAYPVSGHADGPPLNAQFSEPTGLTFEDTLYVAEKANKAVRTIYHELRLTAIYPRVVPLAGGQIHLFGTGFTRNTTVRFGNSTAILFYGGPTELWATAPAGAEGPVDVSVITPAGTATLPDGLTHVGVPTITSVTPNKGLTPPGNNSITIIGTGFVTGATEVYFGFPESDEPATDVSITSGTSLSATTPSLWHGHVPVRIVTPMGEATLSDGYAYFATPEIWSLTPESGYNGSTMIVEGGEFDWQAAGNVVKFGDVVAEVLESGHDFIQVTVPAAAVTGKISVTTFGGTTISPDDFIVLPTSIIITPSPLAISAGQQEQLTATAMYPPGTPSHDVTTTAIWVSSDHTVITVGSQGLVTAVTGGNATISASFDGTDGSIDVAVSGAEPLPPDPSTVAPPVDPTVNRGLGDSISFLFTGTNPIQTGVAAGTIVETRAAVIKGRVLNSGGQALSGVKMAIFNHPEFGQTLSRADGHFDLAVNGGEVLTVRYEKSGYLPIDRQVSVPWIDYALVDDGIMIALDPIATPVDLTASQPALAQGSVMSDADGSRRATVIFNPSTTASMRMPDGSTQPLTTITVRATEYTVGTNGPRAMPAPLPPTSGYTYCVELSVDEATAAGAVGVEFNQPVGFYVDNFLDFPVGTIVPAGFYDRVRGVWVPSENGRVLEIVAIEVGRAYIDFTGDGLADDLTPLGIEVYEREQLASLYGVGKRLWRTPMRHFSPADLNNPIGPPPTAITPSNPLPESGATWIAGSTLCSGSVVDCENQVLGERVEIVGTPFRMHYASDRVPGRITANKIKIPLTPSSVPSVLKRIDLEIHVAGRVFKETFPPLANQTYTFTWDRKDAYGRTLQGEQTALIRMGYVYDEIYQAGADRLESFALTSGVPLPSLLADRRTGNDVILWQQQRASIGSWDSRGAGLGSWTIDVHHRYDPVSRTLQLGNGGRRGAALSGNIITTVAGGGSTRADGVPATTASLDWITGLAVGPDGTLYISDGCRVRRVSGSGIITTVAGELDTCFYNGDGIPATQAGIYPYGLSVSRHGGIYIADSLNHRVRRVRPDGIIETAAGTGVSSYNGDDIPAIEANLQFPDSVTVASDGSFYIADTFHQRVRRVSTSGRITTVAGDGVQGYSGDGGPATAARLRYPSMVKLDHQGNLYVNSTTPGYIRRIANDGTISTIAGDGTDTNYGDGIAARDYSLDFPDDFTLLADGSIFLIEPNEAKIHRITSDGIITTAAGNGEYYEVDGDGGPPNAAKIGAVSAIASAPDGSIYISNDTTNTVRRISPAFSGLGVTERYIPSDDGSEAYVFDGSLRHIRTVDALTDAIRYQFAYDSAGRLSSITDADGNFTQIERDGSGNPSAVVAPFGQRTTLTLNPNGYLNTITNPAGDQIECTYSTSGLLMSWTNARDKTSTFTYDADGRLTRHDDAAGGAMILSRTESGGSTPGFTVTRESALGRTNPLSVFHLASGALQRFSVAPSGEQTQTLLGIDESRTVTSPDGTVVKVVQAGDPRFGMQAPIAKELTITAPSGNSLRLSMSRTASTGSSPTDLISLSDTFELNGRAFSSSYDGTARRMRSLSPLGREIVQLLDLKGRLSQTEVPGITPSSFFYDAAGRLSSIQQGTRTHTLSYNSAGLLSSMIDPLSRTVSFTYDNAGRVLTQTLPDSRVIGFSYDANGNVSSITPPGRPQHAFAYTPVDLEESYTPPDLGAGNTLTQYSYNFDRQLIRVLRPDGAAIDLGYDAGGRLSTLTTPSGLYENSYNATTGNLSSIVAPGSSTITYAYDGSLLSSAAWSGATSGTVSFMHDNDFRVITETAAGSAINFGYDADSLLTSAGSLTLTRDPQNGLLTGSSLGSLTDLWTYSGFGEVASYAAKYGSTEIFRQDLTRDAAGRIAQNIETVSGVSSTYGYGYDQAGRLITVTKDGPPISSYTYDSNSNRLSHNGTTGIYDAQDRLLSYGNATFTYSANGELQTKTEGGQTTSYEYDVLGNLREVTLPDGTVIDYLIDGQNRRVGKNVNGLLSKQWLYADQLRPVAELDGSGNVISRFVYASRTHVPDFMVKAGVTYRMVSDQLGSVRQVVDISTGSNAQRIDYDEFGSVTSDTNPGFQPFGFAGGLYDTQTKLVRFGARDYDPQMGRWMAKDPILFEGRSTNVYGYAFSDPVNFIDREGTFAIGLARAAAEAAATWGIFDSYRDDMVKRAKDPNRPSDKWYHCMANCMGSTLGTVGYLTSAAISFGREAVNLVDNIWDGQDPRTVINDCRADMRANDAGRKGSRQTPCTAICSQFR